MKLSETTGEQRKAILEYVDNRWKQLHELSKDRAEKTWGYLMLTNSGSAVAVLSFMGANKSLTPIPGAPVMLLFFLVGVVLVGVGHALAYYRSYWLFSGWREDVSDYFSDKLTWNEVQQQDKKRYSYSVMADAVGWLSFGCFLTGLGVGITNAMKLVI